MAPATPDLAVYLQPALCAHLQQRTEGGSAQCTNGARNACGGCQLVQYCSKECQKADWARYKAICKPTLMKKSWMPTWHHQGRTPDHYQRDIPEKFSLKRYHWGNIPALDVLKLAKNEDEFSRERDFELLFAASGDLRNVIKTILGLPQQYQGKCSVVINDKDFQVVARNVIMLLIGLHLDTDTAVPLIIHIWYSAFIPAVMLQVLQSSILPLITNVCDKIRNRASNSLQAKTFTNHGRVLCLVFTKEQWMLLPTYFDVPEGLTREKAQRIRHRMNFAPEMLD